MTEFGVGDRVVCNAPGSWVHGQTGTVQAVDVISSDNIHGYQVKIDGSGGYTVMPPSEVSGVIDLAVEHMQASVLIEQAAELVRHAAIKLSGTAWSGTLSNTTSDLHDTARSVRDYDPTGD